MISYIIPARNEEKYIGDCIKSIVNQDIGEDKEIIVIDNNSVDHTAEVARATAPSVKVFFEQRPGINFARQKGFENSSGDVVVFIDADVRLPVLWTKQVLNELKLSPKAVAVSGPYRFYDLRRAYWDKVLYFSQYLAYYWGVFTNVVFGWNSILIAGDMAIRRSALQSIGGFDTRYVFYREDVDTAKRLLKQGKVIFRMKYWVYSSARRFNKVGLWRLILIYVFHHITAIFSRSPARSNYSGEFR